jgi:endoglucanase
MFEILKQLIGPVAPSGCEGAVADVIEALAKPYGEVSRDVLGNVIVHKPGSGKKIMAAAHMDSIGVVATYLEDNGFVRFGALGGLRPVSLIAQRVRFGNGTVGVICADGDVAPKDLAVDKLYIDTAGQPVRVGDVAAFVGEPVQLGDLVMSPYLDDRIGCAVLLAAMQQTQNSDNDLYFAFTVQEEVGTRGAGPAAFAIEPELGIAVDVCGAGDTPAGAEKNDLTVGGGPVLKLMDVGTISNYQASQMVEQVAKGLDIPVQRNVATRGGTDARAMQVSRSGAVVTQLGIATRYIHSPNEMASLRDAAQCATLLAAVMNQ